MSEPDRPREDHPRDDAEPWYVAAFRAEYLDVYAHRDDDAAGRETAWIMGQLFAMPRERLLDAGCGAGRHSRAFAERRLRVTGLDLAEPLLRRAQAAAAQAHAAHVDAAHSGDAPTVDYVRGDVRALPFATDSFAHTVSLFTSFGYFDEDDNATHLHEIRRVTKPGGVFLIDFLNAEHVERTLVPRSERTLNGVHILEERSISAGRVEKTVTMTGDDGETRRWRESVRLYNREELIMLLGGCGFEVGSVFGGLAGEPWSMEGQRTVVRSVTR